MSMTKVKKLLKIGDSYAVVLPKEFVGNGEGVREVRMEISRDEIYITPRLPEKMINRDLEFFGKFGSGLSDLGVNRKKYLKEYLDAKHRHH